MTTKLIQELAGLAVDKSKEGSFHVFYSYAPHVQSIDIRVTKADTDYYESYDYVFTASFYLTGEDAPAQLQVAIDKVKAL